MLESSSLIWPRRRCLKMRSRDRRKRFKFPFDRGELLAIVQKALHTVAGEIGLWLAGQLLEDEMAAFLRSLLPKGLRAYDPTLPSPTGLS